MSLKRPSIDQAWSPSEQVIQAVADQEGVDPTDLEVPLFAAIDPEMLDSLVRSAAAGTSESPLRVEFTYYGSDVEVTSDGTVRVSNTR